VCTRSQLHATFWLHFIAGYPELCDIGAVEHGAEE